MLALALIAVVLTPDTELTLTTGLICTLVAALSLAIWRLANFVRDLRDELRTTWSFRDQERWALQLERENRKMGLFVPNVERAKSDGK